MRCRQRRQKGVNKLAVERRTRAWGTPGMLNLKTKRGQLKVKINLGVWDKMEREAERPEDFVD